jgi:hypothetical protein
MYIESCMLSMAAGVKYQLLFLVCGDNMGYWLWHGVAFHDGNPYCVHVPAWPILW